MRLVFDTNIFISALVFPGGLADKAILKIIEGDDSLMISKAIIDEVLTVLAGKFARDSEALSRTAVYLDEISQRVRPTRKISVLKDEPDNRILECALAGKADAIVTGDKAMLELKEYKSIKIISLRNYLQTGPGS